MKAALTFDDGPSSEWTWQILDLLAEHSAYATFFVLGEHFQARPEIIERMFGDGHEIGVHGWSHERMTHLSEDGVRAELKLSATRLRLITGEKPRLWRAPHLDVNEAVLAVAGALSLRHVGATVDPGDWAKDSAEGIADHVQRNLRDRDIVLLHDGIPPDGGTGTKSRQPTVDAVRLLLEREPMVDWVTVPML